MPIISRVLIILCLIPLIGCIFIQDKVYVPSTMNLHKVVYIDRNLTDYENMLTINALKNWECSTGGMVQFKIKQGASPDDIANIEDPFSAVIITNVEFNDPDIVAADRIKNKKGIFVVGLETHMSNGIDEIKIVESLADLDQYQALMEHEVGHLLGLVHTEDHSHTIMTPVIRDGAMRITQEDIEQFCNIYRCDARDMMACD
jgi:hypothetical protein